MWQLHSTAAACLYCSGCMRLQGTHHAQALGVDMVSSLMGCTTSLSVTFMYGTHRVSSACCCDPHRAGLLAGTYLNEVDFIWY
jgi:hypothetical protein